MTVRWHSLYCPSNDSSMVAETLRSALTADGFTLTDPFGRFPGKVYADNVRMFVAPAVAGWVRILAAPDSLPPPISADIPLCLYIALEDEDAQITVYRDGETADLYTTLGPHLQEGVAQEHLEAALRAQPSVVTKPGQSAQTSIPLNVLPEDVQRMAGGVNLKQAEKLFNRAAKGIFRGSSTEDARALLSEDTAPNWDSRGGRQIIALMACLTIPADWRVPDFTAVRDAYPLYLRKQRKPDAALYPGDAEIMALVPDGLSYTPVYGGR